MTVRARAVVDTGAIERNCARLARALTGGAALCAVVKADGYGHGAVPAARAALAGGATWLAVATANEAAELRAAGIDARVLVMGALAPGEEVETALAARADVVAWDVGFVEDVASRAAARGDGPVRVHVKLDTGMGRLGTRSAKEADEVVACALGTDGVALAGAMTHFATSDDDPEFMAAQLAAFRSWADEVRRAAPGAVAHASNSAGTLRAAEAHLDMVRCGIAIYGLDPFHFDPAEQDLEPALRLESYVAAVKRAAPGESAGYGRRWVAEEETWVGTLPIGYADGVRRALTNNADVLVGGERRPLIGTVSMDNITVDLGPGADPPPVAVGSTAVLIGRQGEGRILAEELAERLGTINYEVTCGISARVPREYEP